jgi:hypothetical protein
MPDIHAILDPCRGSRAFYFGPRAVFGDRWRETATVTDQPSS